MSTPVWLWPAGQTEPVLAAMLAIDGATGMWRYTPEFLAADVPAPDPIRLSTRLGTKPLRFTGADGLPGVVRDAMPQGYGADRIVAMAGRALSLLELLERGLPDATGALEVCTQLERKLAWQPGRAEDLERLATELEEEAPPSRAIRRLNGDIGTSQGGEKPKTTVVYREALWLAKMRDRGGLSALPAREFVTMQLAKQLGIRTPPIALLNAGAHQIFLIQRFDRDGPPSRPGRRMVASAHTVLELGLAAVRGDTARSYLVLADKLRRWGPSSPHLRSDLQELWRRMVFNALVGNTDDHPRNHAFLWEDSHWRLSPAFDITPTLTATTDPSSVVLAMDVCSGPQRSSTASIDHVLAACHHFDLLPHDAAQWLLAAAATVASRWEALLRSHVLETETVRARAVLDDCRPAFAFAEWITSHPNVVSQALEQHTRRATRRRR